MIEEQFQEIQENIDEAEIEEVIEQIDKEIESNYIDDDELQHQ